MTVVPHRPWRLAFVLAAAGLCMVALASPAAALTCAEEIARVEQEYGLSDAPHREPPSGAPDRRAGPLVTELSESKRAQMEALLNAAKAAEQQRQTAECFAYLSEARSIPEPG
jgi:hypothetical protein